MVQFPICNIKGQCFAKVRKDKKSEVDRCILLKEAYEEKCPFQKPHALVTKGVFYPYRPVTAESKPELRM